MKTLYILCFILFFINISISQQTIVLQPDPTTCDYFEDFSNPTGWTQVGSLVEIKNQQLEFINGAPCGWPNGIQRRIYKKLDAPIIDSELWSASFKFTPLSVGDFGGPFTGHILFSLTNNSQDPISDCPDLNCTGFPPGTQDAVYVSYGSTNPPNGNLNFAITVRSNTIAYSSPSLTYNNLGDEIYVVLTKNHSQYLLNIFSDASHTNPLGNGPVSLDMICLTELNYIQHGTIVPGYYLRQLTGSIDDVCIKFNGKSEPKYSNVNYKGCKGDGYTLVINGKTYNESNPIGNEYFYNSVQCADSIVNINMIFNTTDTTEISYEGVHGDGYSIVVNGVLYNESNPTGNENLTNVNGCDSLVTINLTFKPKKDDCITFKPGSTEGKDALLISQDGKYKINFGKDPQLTAMTWNNNDHSGLATIRSVFGFNFDLIPKEAEIISAKLSLFAWDSDSGYNRHGSWFKMSNESYIKRITSNWDENTVTWFNQPSTTVKNQVTLPKTISGDQDYIDIDVTNLVKDMFKYQESSFGFMLKLKYEAVYRRMNFASSDHPDPAKWPELEICYKIKENLELTDRSIDKGWDFTIYPNPASSTFNIEIPLKDLKEYELEILDLSLQTIYKTKDISSETCLNNYPKGMYFVKIKNQDKVKIKKLVLQ